MRRRAMEPRRGHTLVEVLVVLAVLGVALAAVAPTVVAMRPAGAPQAADALLAVLRQARAEAVRRGVVTTVVLDPVARRSWLAVGDEPLMRAGAPLAAGGDVAFVGTGPRMRYVFLPTGIAFGDPLVIRDDARTMLVRVNQWTGAVDVDSR